MFKTKINKSQIVGILSYKKIKILMKVQKWSVFR